MLLRNRFDRICMSANQVRFTPVNLAHHKRAITQAGLPGRPVEWVNSRFRWYKSAPGLAGIGAKVAVDSGIRTYETALFPLCPYRLFLLPLNSSRLCLLWSLGALHYAGSRRIHSLALCTRLGNTSTVLLDLSYAASKRADPTLALLKQFQCFRSHRFSMQRQFCVLCKLFESTLRFSAPNAVNGARVAAGFQKSRLEFSRQVGIRFFSCGWRIGFRRCQGNLLVLWCLLRVLLIICPCWC